MEIVILKLLWFVFALIDGIYIGVLVHELGHASAALLMTRQRIHSQVGTNEKLPQLMFGRLSISLGLAGFRYGSTRYDRKKESKRTQRCIIVAGPLFSLIAALLFGAGLWQFQSWSWIWIVLLAFFVANLRILIVSVWPIEHPAPDGSGGVWLSDGLDFWRTGRDR